jgi:very-short-patch-repair endonuclease
MRMNEREADVLRRAGEQYGVITREQARNAGLTDRQIDTRLRGQRWLPLYPAVFRVAGAPVTARQRALAACLWLGDGAVISHLTAAAVLRFDGIRGPALHVTVPRSARSGVNTKRGFALHSTTRLSLIDRVTVDGIPCTSGARTLIDIAALVDDEALEIAFESARRMRLTSVDHLARRFLELGGRGKAGSARVCRLLERQRVDDRPLESPLEVKVWRLLRDRRIPLPERQVAIGDYRVDMLWPEHRVILECDGFEAHAGHLRWKRDRRRVAAIEAMVYRFVHVTWDDVTRRPDEVIARIGYALALAA